MHSAMFALGVAAGIVLLYALRRVSASDFVALVITAGRKALADGIRVRVIKRTVPDAELGETFQDKAQVQPLAPLPAPDFPAPELAAHLPGPDAKFEEFLAAVPQSMPVVSDSVEAEGGGVEDPASSLRELSDYAAKKRGAAGGS